MSLHRIAADIASETPKRKHQRLGDSWVYFRAVIASSFSLLESAVHECNGHEATKNRQPSQHGSTQASLGPRLESSHIIQVIRCRSSILLGNP